MAFVYSPYELFLFFVKIPNCLISLFLAFKIKRLSGYLLNHLYYMAYLCWGVFIGTDAVLFIIAANDPFSYMLANIFRDISVAMIALIPPCFIIAGVVINKGEETAMQMHLRRVMLTFLLNFVLAVTMILTDSIVVYDLRGSPPYPVIDPSTLPPAGDFIVNFDTGSPTGAFGSAMILVFVAWYIYSVGLMFVIQRGLSGKRRRRARSIMLGTLMIPLGIVFFILLGYFPVDFPTRMVLVMAGHVIWMLSPVLVYMGMKQQVPVDATAIMSQTSTA